jgi:hypothetical protein
VALYNCMVRPNHPIARRQAALAAEAEAKAKAEAEAAKVVEEVVEAKPKASKKKTTKK